MNKFIALAAATLVAGAAHAGDVYWSIGINAPPVGTVLSNAPLPVYAPAPVYVVPQPVYLPPPPVYVAPPPRVVYRPAPVVVPAPVYYAPAPVVVYGERHRHRHRHDGWRGHRDEYGDYREGRWNDQRRFRHDR